ncbi:hypothetical protein ABPH35_02110 [Streptococcus sp. ZJ93]|uniref:hypothetical protein n=1 Tax=Streptococcus handemini TaxID=3161188 RepID=UPI0032EF427A
MTAIPLKENLFKAKIAAVRIAHSGDNSLLPTANTIDFLPATLPLYAEIDFFNIISDYDYTLSVSLITESLHTIPVHATRVNIPAYQMSYKSGTLGKAQGNIDFNIILESEGDYLFLFTFLDISGEVLDTYYQYLTIVKE